MRIRLPLCSVLSTTALVAAPFLALPAAAQCVDDGTAVTCTGPGNAALNDATDGKSFFIEPGAGIGPLNGRALTLSGDDQSVKNEGLIESLDDEAVRATGARLVIDNAGIVRALQDRAIRLQGDADDALIINRAGAVIESQDQAIRPDNEEDLRDLRIENFGTIQSTNGRAIQSRGEGTSVLNFGDLFGGEEVIEARTDFTLENYGTIRINDGVIDEDGVQFSSGQVDNFGLIQGSDDGIDVDEGLIVNHAGGVIRALPPEGEPGGNGIDADELLQDNAVGDLPVGVLRIQNAGLIEGPKAIAVAEGRPAAIDVVNSGILRGTSGVAIDFDPGMDASTVEIFDQSIIFGSVLLTDNDDTVTIGALNSGSFTNAFFDGRGGTDTLVLDGYALGDVARFLVSGASASLTLSTLAGNVTGEFRNFDLWSVGDVTYTTAELSGLAPVPLPAALPLLGASLVGLWALRRRRAT